MFWKRQIPIAIVALVGTLTLFGWFTDQPTIKTFVDDDATQWYDILASFAIFLGALNLLKLQFQKIIKQKRGWQYSIFAILGFLFAFTAGFLMRGAYTVDIRSAGGSPQAVAQVLANETDDTVEESGVLLGLIEEGIPYTLEIILNVNKSQHFFFELKGYTATEVHAKIKSIYTNVLYRQSPSLKFYLTMLLLMIIEGLLLHIIYANYYETLIKENYKKKKKAFLIFNFLSFLI